MKDVAYYKEVERWAKMPPEDFTKVFLDNFAEKFAETAETMKSDVERLREKKAAVKTDTVIPADCEAAEVYDYLTNVPKDPEFLLEGLIYQGTVTQLLGVIKCGKTTWLFTFLTSMLDGKPFMGQKTVAVNVLYISEQPRASLSKQLLEASLKKKFLKKFFVVDISKLWSMPWNTQIITQKDGTKTIKEGRASAIRKLAAKVDAGLVVIDTFPRLAQIKEMASIGEMNEAFESIAPVASDGRCLLLSWHERKAGGTIFEAAAGTAASGGAMDMMIRIQRIPGAKLTDRSRLIEATGRFDSFVADGIAIELLADRSDYKVLGDTEVAAKRNVEFDIQKILRDALPEGLTENEIIGLIKEKCQNARIAPPSRATIGRALNTLLETQFVRREGKGVRKSPHTFYSTENLEGSFYAA